jgi:cell wall-associated NlpC family hydrolase
MQVNRRRYLVGASVAALLAASGTVRAQDANAAAPAQSPTFATRAGELLFRAMSLLGTRYHRGGRSPDIGFDCSGFVGYLYQEVLNLRLPRSAWEIWNHGEEVARETLEPGDLVFFNTMRRPFSHVGVFIGDDKFIHAPAAGGVVRTESINEKYWARRWNGAKRIAT